MSSFSWNHMGPISKSAGNSLSFLFLMFGLMIFSGKTIATDTLTQSEKLSVEQTLISLGQFFELGFFSPGNSSKRYVGIWYRNKPLENILWVANRENPLSASDAGSALTVGTDGNLVLLDGMKRTVWTTNVSSHPNSTVAVLSDNGNLILKDNVSGLNLWEGFNHPCDTLISGMKLGQNNKTGEMLFLSSWRTKDDPSPGNFFTSLTAQSPPQTFVMKSSKPYWRSGPWDGSRFVGVVDNEFGYANGYVIDSDIKQGYIYVTYDIPSLSNIGILYITPDGNLKESQWNTKTQKGHVTWTSIVVPCDVYGACGPFGVCNRVGSQSCECLKGFVPKSIEEWKNEHWTSGCVRRSELLCEKNIQKDGFSKLTSMKLPDQYSYFYNLDSSGCEQWCLSNCSCTAYAYSPGIRCLVWVGSLLDTQKIPDGVDLFLRLAHSELGEKELNMKLIICLTTISGVVLLGALLFGLQRRKANKKVEIGHPILKVESSSSPLVLELCATPTESLDIPMFDFNTLVVATDNFSETNKLGRGGFGLVYKGKLEDGREIAVKRLSIHSGQGVEEFKNEILLISKLQHRNLVRLLGYCIKADEKLLIYEYMKNKSLDTLLFDSKSGVQLDWAKRFNIIEGVARGLLYLHRDSHLRIIHRDLKASNILLDEKMDPKISDFGVARSFDITQELADTQRVVGTFGYISPEYAMGGLLREI